MHARHADSREVRARPHGRSASRKLPPVVGRELETSLVIDQPPHQAQPSAGGTGRRGRRPSPRVLRSASWPAKCPSIFGTAVSRGAAQAFSGGFNGWRIRAPHAVGDQEARRKVILFIDGSTLLIGSGGRTGAGDAASI